MRETAQMMLSHHYGVIIAEEAYDITTAANDDPEKAARDIIILIDNIASMLINDCGNDANRVRELTKKAADDYLTEIVAAY